MNTNKNMNKPKVSVVIPVYNVREYLAESLDSVINQSYKNLEIILINDGSDDGSEIICEEYAKKDSRIKLINKKNGGISSARNAGLDNITGEYVIFLDSDDAFENEAIEKAVNAVVLNDVDCAVFQYHFCKTSKNGSLNKKSAKNNSNIKQGVYQKEEALKLVADHIITSTAWGKLTKREIWENLRFPEGHVYEDLYIIFQIISKIEKLYLMEEPLLLYRIRPGSINFDNSIKNTQDLLDAWSVFENFIEDNTPGLFDSVQLLKSKEKTFNYLVLRYAKTLPVNFLHKTEVLNMMKEKIIELEKVIKIENCGGEIRLLYYMIFNHPKLLSVFFIPFYKIFKIIKGVMNNIR